MVDPAPQDQPAVLATRQGRQRLVLTALRLTENTPLAPQAYEKALLDQFVDGAMTIEQVLDRLDESQQD